jgi:hypothetical protein
MGKEHGSLRRAATKKIGAFVAVLVLALSVPSIALAANTATFSGVTPKAGSSSSVTNPHVVVTVYDRYGVTGTHYWMKIDGVKVAVRLYRFPGTGYNKFKLGYYVPSTSALSNGVHNVTVRVTDRRSKISTFSWSFRVGTSDAQAPVTTSDATGSYTGSATIHLHATDNVGVAHTYYQLDGGTTAEGTVVAASTSGPHFLFFWSVDAAGNIEAKNVAMFSVVIGHALPTNLSITCFTTGCHTAGTDLASIHAVAGGPGCITCHAGAAPTSNCAASGCHSATDSHPLASPHGGTHPAVASSTTTATERCTNTTCHGSSVTSIHAAKGCAICHASSDPAVQAVVTAGLAGTPATCEMCHFNATTPTYAAIHVNATTSHTISGACSSPTCHGTDVAHLHSIDFRGTGETPPGCAACHGAGKTPTLVCETVGCHSASDPHPVTTAHDTAVGHAALKSTLASATTLPGKLCTGCHGNDVLNIQDGQGDPLLYGGKTQHVGCSCHAYGEANLADPSAGCASCHTGFNDPTAAYPYHVGYHNTTLVPNINATAASCAACHGTDVNHVGSRTVAGGTVSVPASTTALVQEHTNCSCHTYNEVKVGTGQTCVGCHDGEYGAIHGWKVSESSHSAGIWNVSGHNTTTMGTVGARSDFSSFASMTTSASAPATFPLPGKNVFWAANDPNAPANAKTGLNWASVITCEDCHSALSSAEVAGPHGGATFDNWGIDANFSGSFDTAFLYGALVGGSNPSADASVVVDANGKGVYSLAGGTPFVTQSGIAQYVPKMVNGTTSEELSAWDLTSGAAHLETATVICVKCHDLYNASNTAGANYGWASYAHEHHAGRPVKFGTFQVGDGGVSVTTQTVVADASTDATAQVAGATIVKTIVAPSLGRETAGACRDCHIAIPHGWKRPRLIVYSNLNGTADQAQRVAKGLPAGDAAPYNAGPSVYENEGLAGTGIGSGQMNGLSSVIGPTVQAGPTDPDGSNKWSSSQCNACGHHSGTDLTSGAWK